MGAVSVGAQCPPPTLGPKCSEDPASMDDMPLSMIHLDQTGFILGRESHDNTIRALNIFHWLCHSSSQPPLLISLADSDEAFERVETLLELGMG